VVRFVLEENMQKTDSETEVEAVSPEVRANASDLAKTLVEGKSVALKMAVDWVPSSRLWKCQSVQKCQNRRYYVYKTNNRLRMRVCAGDVWMYFVDDRRVRSAIKSWNYRASKASLAKMSVSFVCHT